jgi:hypothetical protein
VRTQLVEAFEQGRQMPVDLVRARAGHERDAWRSVTESRCARVERGQVEGFVEEEVPDELRGHVPSAEEVLLEREHAQDHVRAPAQTPDAPSPPRPDLRRDKMDDVQAAPARDGADRRVRSGRIDGDVRDNGRVTPGVLAQVRVDAMVDPEVFEDFRGAW